MRDFVVRFPKPIAIALLVIGLPGFIFLALVSAWMTLSLHTLAGKFPILGMVACYFIFPAMVIFSCASILVSVRYGKETLFTTFRFAEQGINIENHRYGSIMLLWNEIELASYSRTLKIVVLHSDKLVVPIAFSNGRNFPEAVFQLKRNMGARWMEKWI